MVYCSCSLQKSAKMIYELDSLRTVMATLPGADTALNLNLTVFYLISQQFGTCPKTSSAEGRTQFVNSPCAGTTEYVEGHTKTKQAGLRKVNRRITQRMFATSDSRCPVKYLERLISKRPQPHRNSGPLSAPLKAQA